MDQRHGYLLLYVITHAIATGSDESDIYLSGSKGLLLTRVYHKSAVATGSDQSDIYLNGSKAPLPTLVYHSLLPSSVHQTHFLPPGLDQTKYSTKIHQSVVSRPKVFCPYNKMQQNLTYQVCSRPVVNRICK